MDWSNERYVRVYTRDTVTWKLMDWRGRTVLSLLIRKVDRAGVLDVGHDGVLGLAAVLELPLDIVEAGIAQLTGSRGGLPTVIDTGSAYVMPNFIDAQEAPQSDPQRKRESRSRRRDVAIAVSRKLLLPAAGGTIGHETGQDRDVESQSVTPSRAEPVPIHSPDQISLAPRAHAIPDTVAGEHVAPAPNTLPSDGGKPGGGRSGPHTTQQGAATPGQSASSAAGNVAKPQIGPTPDRSDHPPSVGNYNPDDPRARGRLAESTYRRVSDALIALSAEMRHPAPLPFPAITPGSHPQSLRDLQERVREEGAAAPLVCDRVVDNLIAQAREERSVEWLAEKAFAAKPWATARAWMPGAAARRRGPAKGDPLPPAPAPRRAPEPPPAIVIPPDEREDVAAMARELRDRLEGRSRAPPRAAAPTDTQTDQQPQPKAAT